MMSRATASIVGGRDPRSHRLARRGLGIAQDRVQRGEVGRRLADERGSRRVAGVAGPRSADVEDDGIPGIDRAVAGLVMRTGGVGTGGDDREARIVMSGIEQQLADPPADLRLGPSREASRR